MVSVFKKILIVVVLFSFVLNASGVASFFTVKKAQAAWPVSELLSLPTFIQIMKDLAQWIKTELLKALRDAVVKSIIAKIQNDIIQQVTGGNGGDSSFVSDWGSYLKDDIINSTFSEFNDILANDTGIDLCVPFAQQFLSLRLNALTASYGVGQDYLGLPVRCTFDQFKYNLEYTYDFITKGGWASYDALFSPDINPYWISWQVEDKFAQRVAEQKDAKKSEAESSGGFLGTKECKMYGPKTEQQIRDECTDDVINGTAQGEAGEAFKSCLGYLTQQNCKEWGILTPGQAVSEAVTKAIGSDFEYAENVQSAISAIINVLVSKALSEGLQSASGGTTVNREPGDLDGTGFEDYEGETYRQDLEDANRDYDDIIYYITNDLGPIVSTVLAFAHDMAGDGTDLESCPNSRISVDDGSGTKKIYTAAEIIDLLNGFDLNNSSSATSRALTQARANQIEVSNLLDQDNPSSNDVNKVVNKLSNFVRTYQPFYIDVQLVNSGGDGELVTLVWNIYNALRAFNNEDGNDKNNFVCR
ncbi:MAG: hypothetical protein WC705_02590 [Candidatus Paceibacterota bacterium]|jgi:hypothetical protein